MRQTPDQPKTAVTLEQAKAAGSLRPLDRIRLRAQLGLADQVTAVDVRRATELLLQRVLDYYEVVQYTGPGYCYGRVDSTWPSALYAEARFNHYYNVWQHLEMNPVHPTCTDSLLLSAAGWMCTNTAAKLAVIEMSKEVPEAADLLQKARYALAELLDNASASGVNWSSSRRRLRTPGIRKLLSNLQSVLPDVTIGVGNFSPRPVILGLGETWMAGKFTKVSDWSWPVDRLAKSA
jgi:hypothetical protein